MEAINDSFLQTSNLPYVSQEFYRASFTDKPMKRAPRLRVHFAAGILTPRPAIRRYSVLIM